MSSLPIRTSFDDASRHFGMLDPVLALNRCRIMLHTGRLNSTAKYDENGPFNQIPENMKKLLIMGMLLVFVGRSEPARADTVEPLYSELRDLIEDVIRSEVIHTVASTISKEQPALCFYFRGAIGRLQSSYWGGVPAQLREGLALMTADFALWQLKGSSSAEGCQTKGSTAYDAFKKFVCTRNHELKELVKNPLSCTNEAWSQQETSVENSCQGKADDKDQLPCAVAQSALALLRGQLDEGNDVITDYLINTIGGEKARLFRLIVNGTKDAATLYKNIAEEIGGPIANLENETNPCKLAFDLPSTSPCWFLDFASILKADQITITIWLKKDLDPSKAKRIEKTLSISNDLLQLVRNPKSLFNEVAIPAVPPQPDGSGAVPEVTEWNQIVNAFAKMPKCGNAVTVDIALDTLKGTFGLSEKGICELTPGLPPEKLQDLALVVEYLEDARRNLQAFERALNDFGIKPRDLSVKQLRDSVVELKKLATSAELLRGVLGNQGSSEERKRTLDALMRRATRLLSEPIISNIGEDAAKKIEEFRSNKAFSLIIKLIDTRDYRELAVAGLTTILEDSKGLSSTEKTFLAEFVSYVLDTGHSDGEQHTLAKQALRNAVKQLLLTKPTGGVPVSDAKQVKLAIWPAIGVRLEFAGTWYDRSASGYRRSLTADAVTIAFALTNHIGIKGSLIDLASPFTELALRDNTTLTYEDTWKVIVDFVRPRLDIWFALPELTRRVAVFTGASASVLRRDKAENPTNTVTYKVGSPEFTINIGAAIILW